jgi:hypothetical protein
VYLSEIVFWAMKPEVLSIPLFCDFLLRHYTRSIVNTKFVRASAYKDLAFVMRPTMTFLTARRSAYVLRGTI